MNTPHKCPVCEGQGIVSRPPHVPGDQHEWTDNCTGHLCPACDGKGIAWEAIPDPISDQFLGIPT